MTDKTDKPIKLAFSRSGTTDDGTPFVEFRTPYGFVRVHVENENKARIVVDRDAPLNISGVEVYGASTVPRYYNDHTDRAPWTLIDYGCEYWRRTDKSGVGPTVNGYRWLRRVAVDAVAETFKVRPDILRRGRLHRLKQDAATAREARDAAREALRDAEAAMIAADAAVIEAVDQEVAHAGVHTEAR